MMFMEVQMYTYMYKSFQLLMNNVDGSNMDDD